MEEMLVPETGIDRHDQHLIHFRQDLFQYCGRGCRIDDHSCAFSEFFYPPKRAMQVVVTFPVTEKRIRSGRDKFFQEKVWLRDHHVYLERETGHANARLHDGRTQRIAGLDM